MNHFEGINNLETDETFRNIESTNLRAALPSYQASLPCIVRSEVWTCV